MTAPAMTDFEAWWDNHKPDTTDAYTLAQAAYSYALRPQAVPMTDEQRDAAWKRADERYFAQGTNRIPFAHLLINEVEAHHGITVSSDTTAPAGGEKQA